MPYVNPHSIKIAAERKLMEVTGLSRSQIRARLSAFGRENQQNQLVAQARAQQENAVQGPSPIKTNEFVIPPRGFGGADPKQVPSQQTLKEPIVAFLAVEDGDTMKVAEVTFDVNSKEFVN